MHKAENIKYKTINLINGGYCLVDSGEYNNLMNHRWRGNTKGYAVKSSGYPRVSMHRYLLNAPKGIHVDHINNNKLDNRKENLRLCNQSQNEANKRPRSGFSSAYKGVSWHKATKKWKAQIGYNKKTKHIGCFASEIDAAIAYNVTAKELFDGFALLNKID